MRTLLLSFALAILPMLGLAQGPILRNPITTNAFMNPPQNGWIAIWNSVAGRWSNGVNTASATNDSQPPSTVLSNLTATGVAPGATNAGFYIGSSAGLGTNTSIHRFLKTYGDLFTSSNQWTTGNITALGVLGIEAIGGGFQVSGGSGYRSSGWSGDRVIGTGLGPNPTLEEQNVTTPELQQLVGVTGGVQTNIDSRIAENGGHGTNTTFLNITNLGSLTNVGAIITPSIVSADGGLFANNPSILSALTLNGSFIATAGANEFQQDLKVIGLIDSIAGFTTSSTNIIHSLTEDATPANGDYVLVHDVSTASLTKVQLGNLPGGGGGGGGGTTNAFTGGILWVDQTNGNDALAIATGGRDFMHPWATFTNALRYATNGDTVKVGPGRWNITNGIAAIMPVGVHLQGSGRRSSFITNSLVLNALTAGQGVGIALATDCMVSGFYLAVDAHTNQYRGQIGAVFLTALGLTHNRAFTNAVISDCEIEGGTDAVFVRHDSVCTLRIYNCTIRGKSDVLVFGDNAGSSIEIYNVDSRAIGPYALYPQTDGFIFLAASAIIENSSSYASNNVNWNKAMDLRSGAHVIVRNSKFLAGGTNPTNIFGEAGTLLELQTEDGYDTNRVFGPVLIDRKTFIEASTTTSGVPITNRFTSDYIGSSSATAIGLGTSNTFRWVVDTDGQMYPFVDGIKAIGRDANRVKAMHAVTSVVNQIKMVNGQATNSFLYLDATTNVAVGAFGSGLSFSGGTLTSSGGSGSTNNVAQGIGTSDTTNAVKRHWVYFSGDTNVVVDWTKTNYYIVSPSNTFTVSWANAPSAGGLAQSVRLTVINTNSTSGFFPTNGLNGTPVIMLSAPSTNTYLFNFDGTNFWTDSGQILTTGMGDTNVFNINPVLHGTTNFSKLMVNTPYTDYTKHGGSPTTNILIDAGLGNHFRVLLTNTMGLKITNGYDGQRLEVWAYQDGLGNRGLTLVPNTGGAQTNNFEVGEDATGPLVLTTNQFKKDLMLFIYEAQSLSTNTSRSNWVYHGILRKYPN